MPKNPKKPNGEKPPESTARGSVWVDMAAFKRMKGDGGYRGAEPPLQHRYLELADAALRDTSKKVKK